MDIVIDNDVMSLYDKPKDPRHKSLFKWLASKGTLATSQFLLKEYYRSGHMLLFVLIDDLIRQGRYKKYSKNEINSFAQDKHYNYTCNYNDEFHAKLVFISCRKKLVSLDNNLINDINRFPKVKKIKPNATKYPNKSFYS